MLMPAYSAFPFQSWQHHLDLSRKRALEILFPNDFLAGGGVSAVRSNLEVSVRDGKVFSSSPSSLTFSSLRNSLRIPNRGLHAAACMLILQLPVSDCRLPAGGNHLRYLTSPRNRWTWVQPLSTRASSVQRFGETPNPPRDFGQPARAVTYLDVVR